jgi:GDP-L-fucose synthase
VNVLVLGATGFLGRHVCHMLEQCGIQAIRSSKSLGLDLCDAAATQERLAAWRPDAIINCAAFGGSVHYVMREPADVLHANLLMVLNLYRAAASLATRPLIINAMANCSYAASLALQVETQWLDGPVHPSVTSFGNATRMKYVIAKCYATQHGIPSKNLLFGGMFGPGDHLEDDRLHAFDGIVLRMVRAHVLHEPELKIWGTGTPLREWIFVKDAARALLEALEAPFDLTEPVNVSQGLALSVNDIAVLVQRLTTYPGKIEHDLSYPDGAPTKVLDGRRFRSLFPLFQFTDFEVAVQEAIDYYRQAVTNMLATERVGPGSL